MASGEKDLKEQNVDISKQLAPYLFVMGLSLIFPDGATLAVTYAVLKLWPILRSLINSDT